MQEPFVVEKEEVVEAFGQMPPFDCLDLVEHMDGNDDFELKIEEYLIYKNLHLIPPKALSYSLIGITEIEIF